MVLQIPQHGHCHVCGKAMAWSETERTCSTECTGKLAEIQKKRKRTLTFMYVMMGLSMVLLMLYSLGFIQ